MNYRGQQYRGSAGGGGAGMGPRGRRRRRGALSGWAGVVALLLFAGVSLPAAGAAAPGTCHALIVAGLPGTPVHARRLSDWARRFHAWLTAKAGVPAANVALLGAGGPAAGAPPPPTAEAVLAELRRLAGAARPEDQFVLVWLGHGSTTDGVPKLLLGGPDFGAAELAGALAGLRAGNQVLLLLGSASGDALPAVVGAQRVVIAATSPLEVAEPVFAEFLLRGLESGTADGAGGGPADGTVTVLEAFHWAALETPRWIRRIRRDGDADEWLVSGRDSVALFGALCEAPPGSAGGRRLSPRSRADIPDPDVPLATPAKDVATFAGTRLVGEHAVLEDAGTPVGTAALQGAEFRPLSGMAPGEPGARARRVVLGRPELLPGGAP